MSGVVWKSMREAHPKYMRATAHLNQDPLMAEGAVLDAEIVGCIWETTKGVYAQRLKGENKTISGPFTRPEAKAWVELGI